MNMPHTMVLSPYTPIPRVTTHPQHLQVTPIQLQGTTLGQVM